MKKDLTLVILAAGMGSRFGGLKQVEPIGPNGEFLIDYSIYDAIRAGFTKAEFLLKLPCLPGISSRDRAKTAALREKKAGYHTAAGDAGCPQHTPAHRSPFRRRICFGMRAA